MHWINMTLVTDIAVYPPSPLNGDQPVVAVKVGDYTIARYEFNWLAKAEQFVQHLMTESEGWIEADFYADLAAGRMK